MVRSHRSASSINTRILFNVFD